MDSGETRTGQLLWLHADVVRLERRYAVPAKGKGLEVRSRFRWFPWAACPQAEHLLGVRLPPRERIAAPFHLRLHWE